MSHTKTKLGSVVGLLLAATAIAGCEPQASKWSPAEVRHQPTVEQVRSSLTVFVERTNGELAPGEAERLNEYLQGLGDPFAVRVRLAGQQPVERIRPLADRLVMAGLLPENVTIVAERGEISGLPGASVGRQASASLDPVQITADKYVAVLPGCPNWSHADSDDANQGTSFLGCSNRSNLGAMVADPRDLMIGRGGGMSDAEREAAAVANYRAGKVKPLPQRNSGSVVLPAGGN